MGDFRKLKVWEKAKNLAVRIYQLTDEGKFKIDFRFRDQIRSVAISVPFNIAEGDELGTNRQSVKYFYISKGSTAEVITQLIISHEIGYLSEEKSIELINEYEHLSRMLAKLISVRR